MAAKAISTAVDSLLLVGLVLRVQHSGGGAMANAAVMVAMAIPALVTMRWAGRTADRHDSRTVVVCALVVQVMGCVALTAPQTRQPGWPLYAACLLFQTGYSFANPVWSALVPAVAGVEGVQRIAGAQMLVGSVAAPIGAAGAGLLVGRWGVQAPPAIAGGLLLVVLVLGVSISTRRRPRGNDAAETTSSASGLGFIWHDRVLAGVLLGTLVTAVVIQGVTVVEVFMAINVLGASTNQYGLTEIAFAIGVALASRIVAHLSKNEQRVKAITAGFAGCALACIAIALTPDWWVYLALLGLLGLANSVANGALGPLFLLRTPDHQRGAVIASLNGMLSAATIIAMCAGGLAGKCLGPRHTFLAGGVLTLPGITLMALLAIPAIHAYQPRHAQQ